jgi:hypothetical protein
MPRAEPFGVLKEKGILFGDDEWGTVVDEKPPYKNPRGVEMKSYLIAPSPHMLKTYPELLRLGALEHRGFATWRDYPLYWISDENPSRTNAIVRVDCGFDGRESPQTKRHKKLTDEIKMLREELDNVMISNMHLTEENKLLTSETKEKIKELVETINLVKGEKHESSEYGPIESQ